MYSNKKLPAFKDLATSISEKTTPSAIRVYPNPATNQINIESEEMIRSAELFTIDGKIIKKVNPNSKTLNIRLVGLNAGMYFLRVQTEGRIFTEKIVMN